MRNEITGVRELLNNLAKTEKDVSRATIRANRRAGEVVAKQLEKNTPIGKKVNNRWWGKYKAKDSVVVSGKRTDSGSGVEYVAVGYTKDVAWRMHFVEVGTIKQPPQWFITKTVQQTQSDVQKAMADEIRKVLG